MTRKYHFETSWKIHTQLFFYTSYDSYDRLYVSSHKKPTAMNLCAIVMMENQDEHVAICRLLVMWTKPCHHLLWSPRLLPLHCARMSGSLWRCVLRILLVGGIGFLSSPLPNSCHSTTLTSAELVIWIAKNLHPENGCLLLGKDCPGPSYTRETIIQLGCPCRHLRGTLVGSRRASLPQWLLQLSPVTSKWSNHASINDAMIPSEESSHFSYLSEKMSNQLDCFLWHSMESPNLPLILTSKSRSATSERSSGKNCPKRQAEELSTSSKNKSQ